MREEQIQEAPVKVLLVGVDVGEEPDFERSMEELASLAEAAEKEVAGQIRPVDDRQFQFISQISYL